MTIRKATAMNPPELTLRQASVADAPAIAELIAGLSHYFLATPDGAGAEGFLASLSPTALAACVADPRQDYWLAWRGPVLVGAAALRDGAHVHHLFVAENCHRQGIAGRLWHVLLARAQAPTLTVNASLFAAPVYARWGFVAVGEPQQRAGLSYAPMRLTRGASAPAIAS